MADLQERDVDRLLKILDYCDRIGDCTRRFGDNLNDFQRDIDYRDAIKMNLFQIGESVNSLSDECKEKISDVPWHHIYGMRNVIAHGYEKVKDERVWTTVKEDVPDLSSKIKQALSAAGYNTD